MERHRHRRHRDHLLQADAVDRGAQRRRRAEFEPRFRFGQFGGDWGWSFFSSDSSHGSSGDNCASPDSSSSGSCDSGGGGGGGDGGGGGSGD
jgi:hypothetical protein